VTVREIRENAIFLGGEREECGVLGVCIPEQAKQREISLTCKESPKEIVWCGCRLMIG
jgi:hypothetical protein